MLAGIPKPPRAPAPACDAYAALDNAGAVANDVAELARVERRTVWRRPSAGLALVPRAAVRTISEHQVRRGG